MITPTIGRILWVWRLRSTDIKQAEPAFVTYVHNERLVNVAGFDHAGMHFSFSKLILLQDDDAKPDVENFASWMPYQVTADAAIKAKTQPPA